MTEQERKEFDELRKRVDRLADARICQMGPEEENPGQIRIKDRAVKKYYVIELLDEEPDPDTVMLFGIVKYLASVHAAATGHGFYTDEDFAGLTRTYNLKEVLK